MKTSYIAMAMTAALLTVGLIQPGAAQSVAGSAQEGIEVITVVGKRPAQEPIAVRPMPEGIDVITVVGERPAPTVASTCVDDVLAGRVTGSRKAHDDVTAPALEPRHANRNSLRQAIRDCIEQAQMATSQS